MSDEDETLAPGDADDDTLAAPPSQAPSQSTTGASGENPGLTPGAVIADRYRIVTRLGKGGMGEVFRADDLTLDLPVALKFLPPELANNPAKHAELFAEVKVARQISHPNACRVYDLGEADGVYFLSMEYIDGEDLKSLLRRIGRPPWDKSIELGRQMCEGLGAAHQAGVLHRDLKPANLMIDGEGRARITDFGLATLAASLSGSETIAGTPLYMAPEQFSGKPATVASDLYSLGLVLYELFTGRRVFDASSFVEASKLHQRGIPTPPSELRFGFDPGVESILLRCLEKNPADRPDSVEEVSAALAEGLGGGVTEGAQIATLVACDLALGGQHDKSLEDSSGGELFEAHDRLVRDLIEEHGGREIDKSSGFLILFQRPLEAVRYALAYHQTLAALAAKRDTELAARVGIHLGEVVLRKNSSRDVERGAKPLEVDGFAAPMTAKLMALAGGHQTLLSQGAFDVARRSARGELEGTYTLSWLAHGDYAFEGSDEAAAVFEVGVEGFAPLVAPGGVAGATRVEAEDTILGWRPAPGLPVLERPNWIVQRKLGEGGFGETWLVSHAKSGENRVYKFCYEKELLFSLQREITVFRLLKEELGLRDDIARILDWNLDEAPYFLEFAYIEGGSAVDWARTRGGIEQVPLPERLNLVAQIATALAAAHSIGVLHKDIKPANVLVSEVGEDSSRAILTDFGIGLITDVQRLADKGITVLGMTQMDAATASDSSAGTQLYLAPELLAGKAPTIQADIYSLGVMLYQFAVGDLERPMPHGWKREIDDELLREDIADMVDGSPERRPGSASEVADRLRKLEERRAAQEAERQERVAAEKSQRRRRVLSVATAVSSVFLVVVSILAVQAIRAREDAVQARGEAEALIDYMLFDLRDGLETIGRLDLLAGVARSSREHFESTPADDVSTEGVYRRGISFLNIGDVLFDQGDTEEALDSYRSAEEHFEGFLEGDLSNPRLQAGLGKSRSKIGSVLHSQGQTALALEVHARAVKTARELSEQQPDDLDRGLDLAVSHYELAKVQVQAGENDAALESGGRALALAEDLVSTRRDAPWRPRLLTVDARILLADQLVVADRDDEALELLRGAEMTARRQMDEDRRNDLWRRRLAGVAVSIGLLERARGELTVALRSFNEASVTYQDLVASDPDRVRWKASLASARSLAAGVHRRRGELNAALESYAACLEVYENLAHQDPTRRDWQERIVWAHQNIGSVRLVQGDGSAALAAYGAASTIFERLRGSIDVDAHLLNSLSWNAVLTGRAHAQRGEIELARTQWVRAVGFSETARETMDVFGFRDTHAQALMHLGRYEEARPLVESLVERGWKDPELMRLARQGGLL